VLGIEGREANIAKAAFACEALRLSRVRFSQDDVRNFSREKYGSFDVVLCWGLLYHLNAPDVFAFLENVARACRQCAVIDTHISLTDQGLAELPNRAFRWADAHPKELQTDLIACTYRGREYWGRDVPEHDPATTPEQRLESQWASLDNVTSFWPTFESLVSALVDAGFTSVLKSWAPVIPGDLQPADRVTLVAAKSEPAGGLRVAPGARKQGPWRLAESGDAGFALVGLVRATDLDARRHRYSAGHVPRGLAAGELGALLAEPTGDCDPLWVNDEGYVFATGQTCFNDQPSLPTVLRWVADPLTWRKFSAVGPKARAVARRALDGVRIATSGSATADPPGEPAGYLLRSPTSRTVPLYSAIHPVTGDQLLSTDPGEAARLGYGDVALLGYLVAKAPVTGKLGPIRPPAPWAARFGLVGS
jgi:hypothetical protein